MSVIEEKLKLLPEQPGVYIMRDKNGNVIYVGKAKILKNRVRQYFYSNVKTAKVSAMVANIVDFEYIITKSEIDALSLENNLIKKYKPRYNILLKDDKTYPYIKINLKEDFPTFTVTRRIRKDGSKYFGPFMGGVSVNDVVAIINQTYGIRPCNVKINANKVQKVCLNYYLGKCSGECAGLITKEEYMKKVNGALDFLNGNDNAPEVILKQKMTEFAEKEEFEIAQSYKEKLAMLDKIKLKRITALNRFINADVISLVTNNIYTAVNMLFIRSGRMVGGKNFQFDISPCGAEEDLTQFIIRYYKTEVELPDEVIVNLNIDAELTENYFKTYFDKSLSVLYPKQGVRKQLSDMAKNNASDYLDKVIDKINHKEDMTLNACARLQTVLGLKNYPRRMECYDISNVSGVDKVGSMVVFIDGEPAKDLYRKFKIKTVEGANDYESHKEMMRRRLARLTAGDENFAKPDMIIIDGGKGQLSSVMEVFKEFNVTDIALTALAEREEEIYTTARSEPFIIDRHDYVLKLMQRIRDEAHRFAITYFKKTHVKRNLESELDEINGIGKAKRIALTAKFGSVSAIKKASVKELSSADGIGQKLAEEIYAHFHKGE